MAAAFDLVRDAWRDAGRAEPPHLSSSIWYALGPDAEEQLHSYAYNYLKIFGEEIGRGAASMATCFGADALRQTLDNVRAPVPTSSCSSPPPPIPTSWRGRSTCSATSTAGSEAACR